VGRNGNWSRRQSEEGRNICLGGYGVIVVVGGSCLLLLLLQLMMHLLLLLARGDKEVWLLGVEI
jgi:hypothetical protein